MYYVSFPGLGIEPFHIDKVAFSVFGRGIAWYGILITFGMILAVLYALRTAEFEKITSDDLIDFAFAVIIIGVIGARLYYVIFKWDSYWVWNSLEAGGFADMMKNLFSNLWATFKNIIAVWEGGLGIYGGVLAGLATAYVYSRIKKIPFLKLADILVPCVLIGQVIGRWGNFINIEAYGADTELPWRMGILYSYTDTGITTGVWDIEHYVHPAFLYESLWNLTLLVFVLISYKKKKFNGQWLFTYMMWYGFGRMLIEGLRTDSLMLGSLRISQGVGFVSLILGAVMMILYTRKAGKQKADEAEYSSVYDKLKNSEITTENENNKTEE